MVVSSTLFLSSELRLSDMEVKRGAMEEEQLLLYIKEMSGRLPWVVIVVVKETHKRGNSKSKSAMGGLFSVDWE